MNLCGCLGNLVDFCWNHLSGSRLELGWTHLVEIAYHNCLIVLGSETSWALKSWWWQRCESRIDFLLYWTCLGNCPIFLWYWKLDYQYKTGFSCFFYIDNHAANKLWLFLYFWSAYSMLLFLIYFTPILDCLLICKLFLLLTSRN